MREADKAQTETALLKSFIEASANAEERETVRKIERQLLSSPAWRPKRQPRRTWFSAPWFTPAVAGLAALLAVGVWFGSPAQLPVEPVDSSMTRSLALEGIEPVGDLDHAPGTLRWTPVADAASYEVALLDIEEKVIWSARQPGASLRLPGEALALMTQRKTLFWRISAFDSRGDTLVRSAPQRFRVTSN